MRRKSIVLLGLVSSVLTLALPCPMRGDGGDGSLIHGCVDKAGGVRVIAASASCKTNETALHWATEARVVAIEAKDAAQDAAANSLATTVGQQQSAISDLSDVAWEPGVSVGDIGYTAGNVGVGTTDPAFPLHVTNGGQGTMVQIGAGAFLSYYPPGAYVHSGATLESGGFWLATAPTHASIGVNDAAWADSIIFQADGNLTPGLSFNPTTRMIVKNNGDIGLGGVIEPAGGSLAGSAMAIVDGDVGIGTTAPIAELHVEGSIFATGGISSSRELKESIMALSEGEAVAALDQLRPVKFLYKGDPHADTQLGFVAEDVPDLVSTPLRKGIQPFDIIAVLTKALQVQQDRIGVLEQKLARLEAAGGAAGVDRTPRFRVVD